MFIKIMQEYQHDLLTILKLFDFCKKRCYDTNSLNMEEYKIILYYEGLNKSSNDYLCFLFHCDKMIISVYQ